MTNILIVEDEHALLEDLRMLFEFEGFEVRTASNGMEALEAVRVETPDLICSDLLMPDMNGYDMLKALRADERWVDVPVVLVTAKTSRADHRTGQDAGATAYISKPFTVEELLKVVHDILAQRD